jgi:microcystin-dependent protein
MRLKVVVVDWEIPPRVKRWASGIAIPAAIVGLGTIAYAAVPVAFTSAGKNQPHNNIQPSVFYLYCEKQ